MGQLEKMELEVDIQSCWNPRVVIAFHRKQKNQARLLQMEHSISIAVMPAQFFLVATLVASFRQSYQIDCRQILHIYDATEGHGLLSVFGRYVTHRKFCVWDITEGQLPEDGT